MVHLLRSGVARRLDAGYSSVRETAACAGIGPGPSGESVRSVKWFAQDQLRAVGLRLAPTPRQAALGPRERPPSATARTPPMTPVPQRPASRPFGARALPNRGHGTDPSPEASTSYRGIVEPMREQP